MRLDGTELSKQGCNLVHVLGLYMMASKTLDTEPNPELQALTAGVQLGTHIGAIQDDQQNRPGFRVHCSWLHS